MRCLLQAAKQQTPTPLISFTAPLLGQSPQKVGRAQYWSVKKPPKKLEPLQAALFESHSSLW
jgi:hypothetical protein